VSINRMGEVGIAKETVIDVDGSADSVKTEKDTARTE